MALAPRKPQEGWLHRFVPVTTWLPRYDRKWLAGDVLAGLVVWALVVPEALAYAGIAGIPVQYGLYAIPLAVVAYLIFGTSRHLFVGPSSSVAALSAATILPLAASGSGEYLSLTVALALLVGGLYIVFGLLRFGFVANLLARPVLDGFIVGLGIHIAVGQLPKLLGTEGGEGSTVRQFISLFAEFSMWTWITVAIGFGSLAALFLMERFFPKAPGALVVAALGIVFAAALGLADHGVDIVGSIPTGFAGFGLPMVRPDQIVAMIPGAIGIIVVGFAESVAIAKSYGVKHGYTIDPSQEMIGYGAANIGAGLLQGFAVGGSLSKSAVGETSGGKTPLLQAIVSVLTVLTILVVAPLFSNLPEAVLGAIVIHAVWGMIDFSKFVALWKMQTADFWLAFGAGAGVILVGILPGIVIGLALSLVFYFHRTDNPHTALIGRDPESDRYGDVAEHPDFQQIDGAIVYRFDSALIFSNVGVLVKDVDWLIAQASTHVDLVILDFESVWEVDTSAGDEIRVQAERLHKDDTRMVFARVHASTLNELKRQGLLDDAGVGRAYDTVRAAVDAYREARAAGGSGEDAGPERE